MVLYLHINGKRMSLPTVVMTAFSTLLVLTVTDCRDSLMFQVA
jgi:hypothetical protein